MPKLVDGKKHLNGIQTKCIAVYKLKFGVRLLFGGNKIKVVSLSLLANLGDLRLQD